MKLRFLVTSLFFAVTCAFASAQTAGVPTRVAVVDVQKVLTQSDAGKAAYERLRVLQSGRVAEAKKREDSIRKFEAETKVRQASLSASQLTDRQTQLADKRTEAQRHATNAEREINQSRDGELQALEQAIKPVVNSLGKEMELAAIFNKFESGLIFASDRIDVTDEVIKRFNAASK